MVALGSHTMRPFNRLEFAVRIATIHHQGQRKVGLVSPDQHSIALFDTDGSRGALAIVELLACGAELPATAETLPLAGASLAAPLPRQRRNLFCVGRNYHAHAKELRETV